MKSRAMTHRVFLQVFLFSTFVVAVSWVGNAFPAYAGDLIFLGDFETGDFTGFYRYEGNKPTVVSAADGYPVRAGRYSMRNYVHRYQSPVSYRTEIFPGVGGKEFGQNENFRFDIGEEYWIGFSVYIPSDFVIDTQGWSDIIFQAHATPDLDLGEGWRNPPFAIKIGADKWTIASIWDAKPVTTKGENGYEYDGKATIYNQSLGSDIGKWTDWVIHVLWDYEENGDGFLEIWKDGIRVVNRTSPNCFNDQRGPYIQMGIYKPSWNHDIPSSTDWRLFYHDELRIGGANASYEDVAPGGSSPPVSPTPSPTPTPTPGVLPGLSWEAEEGVISYPFSVSNGYVSQSINTEENPSSGGRASYRFNITTPGDYIAKVVVDARSGGSNSVYVNIDSEPVDPTTIWDIDLTSGFEERTVSWRGSGTYDANEFVPKVFTLSAGEHELIIRGRERDTRLDKLSLEAFPAVGLRQIYLPIVLTGSGQ